MFWYPLSRWWIILFLVLVICCCRLKYVMNVICQLVYHGQCMLYIWTLWPSLHSAEIPCPSCNISKYAIQSCVLSADGPREISPISCAYCAKSFTTVHLHVGYIPFYMWPFDHFGSLINSVRIYSWSDWLLITYVLPTGINTESLKFIQGDMRRICIFMWRSILYNKSKFGYWIYL